MMNTLKPVFLRRSGFTLWLVSLLLFTVAARAQANVPPEQMLQSVTTEMISVLKRERDTVKKEPTKLFDLVEQVLLPHVDMDVMSRFVLGKHWRTATPEQRQRFTSEFKNLLIRFYVSAMLDDPNKIDELLANTDNLITFIPANVDASANKALVRAEVHMPNGGPKVPISFSLFRRDGGEWLLYDVNVDGISLVTNYRSSFATEVSRQGLDALINQLAERNKELLEKAKNGKSATTTQ